MSCQHGNIIIVERRVVEVRYYFEGGKPPPKGSVNNESDPMAAGIEVECQDCGLWKFYGVQAKRPKWVRDAWEKLIEELHGIEI
jgi:hypothetical protein